MNLHLSCSYPVRKMWAFFGVDSPEDFCWLKENIFLPLSYFSSCSSLCSFPFPLLYLSTYWLIEITWRRSANAASRPPVFINVKVLLEPHLILHIGKYSSLSHNCLCIVSGSTLILTAEFSRDRDPWPRRCKLLTLRHLLKILAGPQVSGWRKGLEKWGW